MPGHAAPTTPQFIPLLDLVQPFLAGPGSLQNVLVPGALYLGHIGQRLDHPLTILDSVDVESMAGAEPVASDGYIVLVPRKRFVNTPAVLLELILSSFWFRLKCLEQGYLTFDIAALSEIQVPWPNLAIQRKCATRLLACMDSADQLRDTAASLLADADALEAEAGQGWLDEVLRQAPLRSDCFGHSA